MKINNEVIKKKEINMLARPIMRQKYACKYLGISVPTFRRLEKLGIIKRHEEKMDGGETPTLFYIKSELDESKKQL